MKGERISANPSDCQQDMKDAYADDLAYIHDAGFGHWARNAAAFVLQSLCSSGVERGLVVDLGCGSGILAQELTAAGYDVLGIDQSEAMLALARRRAPGARFCHQSLLAADIPPCLAVTAVGECFNYLFDDTHSDQTLAELFGRIHNALLPGGFLTFDADEPGRVPGPGPSRFQAEGPDWAVLATAEEDLSERLLTRRITAFRQVGDFYRRSHEVHRLRLLPRAELSALLQDAGFQVQILAGHGDFLFPPGMVGYLAAKP